ncbi:hypothetical protein TWF694_009377 [Orbilia ellipsospora]|uniref:F-box domain-containing protein n=1 Tax=Orbilia ellipsospora TaxID=2528407 RepID=A0AAV9XLE3_9PEZI
MDFTAILPNELILYIFGFFPTSYPSPLLPALLTCKRLNTLLAPILYSHITLRTVNDPPGFHQPSIDTLCLPENIERLKKYTKLLTLITWMNPMDDDENFTWDKEIAKWFASQVITFWTNGQLEECPIEEIYIDSLVVTLALHPSIRSRVKSTTASAVSLYSNGGPNLDAACVAEAFTFLSTIYISDLASDFGNFAPCWEFLQSVQSSLSHISFRASGGLMMMFINRLGPNKLPGVWEKYNFSVGEGGKKLDRVKKLELLYVYKLDETISVFNWMVNLDKITSFRVIGCEVSSKFILAVTPYMVHLTELNIEVRDGGREVIDEIFSGLKTTVLEKLRVRCRDNRDLHGRVAIKKGGFEKFKNTLKQLKIEHLIGTGESEEASEAAPVAGDGDQNGDELNLEVLAEFSGLQDIAASVFKREGQDFPVLSKLRSICLNGLYDGVETTFVKEFVECIISSYNRSNVLLLLQVIVYTDKEEKLRWCNLGAHAGLPAADFGSDEAFKRTYEEL